MARYSTEMRKHSTVTLLILEPNNVDSDFAGICECGWRTDSQMQMSILTEWNAHRVRASYNAQFTGV